MEIARTENLSFLYPNSDKKALNNISFNIESGEIVLVCGDSGCGKTTLLKMFKNEIAPFGKTDGEYFAFGKQAHLLENRESIGDIGFVGQNPDKQIVTDKVYHELAFVLESLSLDNKLIRQRVAETAAFFALDSIFNKNTSELSGGQKQLVNLAAAMAASPKLLILDEPTAQLDPLSASRLINMIVRLNKEIGTTVLISEHSIDRLLFAADKILYLDNGSNCFFGKTRDAVRYMIDCDKQLPALMMINRATAPSKQFLTINDAKKHITENYKNSSDEIILDIKCYDECVLSIKNVSFRYKKEENDILNNLSLKVFKSESLAIIGSNGCGKTTLIKTASGMIKPWQGKIKVLGKQIEKYKAGSLYKNCIAVLPQDPSDVFLFEKVEDDLTETAKAYNTDIYDWVDRLGIEKLLQRNPDDLSGGELQKCAIAKVLLTDPKIVFFDEPQKGLDDCSKRDLAQIIQYLTKNGITVVVVTHDLDFAAESCENCAMLFGGEIIAKSTSNEFFSKNSLYTTTATRISKGFYKNAVTSDDLIALCKTNGAKDE